MQGKREGAEKCLTTVCPCRNWAGLSNRTLGRLGEQTVGWPSVERILEHITTLRLGANQRVVVLIEKTGIWSSLYHRLCSSVQTTTFIEDLIMRQAEKLCTLISSLTRRGPSWRKESKNLVCYSFVLQANVIHLT